MLNFLSIKISQIKLNYFLNLKALLVLLIKLMYLLKLMYGNNGF